jgi:hypothetical protein
LQPVLFVDYLAALDPRLGYPLVRWFLIWTFTIILTWGCFRGMEMVGKAAMGVCVFSLLPFVVLVATGMFKVRHRGLGTCGTESPIIIIIIIIVVTRADCGRLPGGREEDERVGEQLLQGGLMRL